MQAVGQIDNFFLILQNGILGTQGIRDIDDLYLTD
jgi:hypothetical protein